MKIYIWEGNGISQAYHNDGTLVMLANTLDEARQIIKSIRSEYKEIDDNYKGELMEKKHAEMADKYGIPHEINWFFESDFWDGQDKSIEEQPSRIIELDKPKWIAFNGGGYD